MERARRRRTQRENQRPGRGRKDKQKEVKESDQDEVKSNSDAAAGEQEEASMYIKEPLKFAMLLQSYLQDELCISVNQKSAAGWPAVFPVFEPHWQICMA
ncbi:hypothetical protein Bca4012_022546 [Brassica carinata]